MKHGVIVSLVVCAVAACAPPAPDAEDASKSEVVGGQAEEGYPAVGYLLRGPSAASLAGPVCGATLIADRLAVTAAHCVALRPSAAYGVSFGHAGAAPAIAVTKAFVHPAYAGSKAPQRYRHDIAVLVLSSAAPVTPARVGAAVAAGDRARYVGYGRTTEGGEDVQEGYTGARKSADQRVERVDQSSAFAVGEGGGLCWGDSGGALMRGDEALAVLADFDPSSPACSIGNRMIFTLLAGERKFLDAVSACRDGSDACVATALRTATFPRAAVCETACANFHYDPGQCYRGWRCVEGCVIEDGCRDACTFECSAFGYSEGQCFEGWHCMQGCVVQDNCH